MLVSWPFIGVSAATCPLYFCVCVRLLRAAAESCCGFLRHIPLGGRPILPGACRVSGAACLPHMSGRSLVRLTRIFSTRAFASFYSFPSTAVCPPFPPCPCVLFCPLHHALVLVRGPPASAARGVVALSPVLGLSTTPWSLPWLSVHPCWPAIVVFPVAPVLSHSAVHPVFPFFSPRPLRHLALLGIGALPPPPRHPGDDAGGLC